MARAPKPTAPVAKVAETSAPATWGGEVLTVMVAGDRFALPAGDIAEITRPRPLTRVPHAPASLLGVINLRGAVLPILSLAGLLGREAVDVSPSSRIVVMAKTPHIGLLVDEVSALSQAADERRIDLDALLARDFGALLPRRQTAARPVTSEPAAVRAHSEDLVLIGFVVADQAYALPLDKVVEVVPLPATITDVPRTDPAMVGVMAFREAILPLVSLRVLLDLPVRGMDRAGARVVVTRIGPVLVGLVVDRMTAILRVPDSAIDPVPSVLTRGRGEAQIEAICRVDEGRKLVAILSPSRLFDSETAARVFAEAKQGSTIMDGGSDQDGGTEQFVVFQLADEHYGLPIRAVDEVVRCPETLTRVPRAPAFIEGVMNLRGKIVPVIDQNRRFGAAAGARGRRVVVVTLDGTQAGFIVDAVSEVLTIAPAEIVAAPDLTAAGSALFDRIATIERDGRMILLIDPKAMLDRAERDMLAALALQASSDGATPA